MPTALVGGDIVCKLAHYRTKEDVIRAARYLRGTGVAISEDHSRRVREERAFLKRHLIDARKQGARAYIRFDKLFINGRVKGRHELEEMERRQPQEINSTPVRSTIGEERPSTPDTAHTSRASGKRAGNVGAMLCGIL